MKVFGIAGYSGSGKTTLLEKLIPQFTARGLRVSVIKHAHHGFDIDRPGKDSHRHREAGATEVMLSCNDRWALMHERRSESELTLDELLARLSPCDLVLSKVSSRNRCRNWKSIGRRTANRRSFPNAATSSPWPAMPTSLPTCPGCR